MIVALLWFFCFHYAIASLSATGSSSAWSISGTKATPSIPSPSSSANATTRNVWLFMASDGAYISTLSNGVMVAWTRSSVFFEAGGSELPMKIDINQDGTDSAWGNYLRVTEFSTNYMNVSYVSTSVFLNVGSTKLSNSDLFNVQAGGDSIAIQALTQDATFRAGPGNSGNINDGNAYAKRLLSLVGVDVTKESGIVARWQSSDAYLSRINGPNLIESVSRVVLQSEKGNFTFKVPSPCQAKWKRASACETNAPLQSLGQIQKRADAPPAQPPPAVLQDEIVPRIDDNPAFVENQVARQVGRPLEQMAIQEVEAQATVTRRLLNALDPVRAGSWAVRSFAAINLANVAARFAGIGSIVVGVILTVVNFINGQGSIFPAITLFPAIIAALFWNPAAMAVSFLFSFFFAVIPGLVALSDSLGHKNDKRGIIQYKMFGDKSKTGNEQCEKGSPDYPGPHNCTIAFGAGLLSVALGMENFDAIMLLEHLNSGMAMTVPDLALFWNVVSTVPDPTPDLGDNVLNIICDDRKAVNGRGGAFVDLSLCHYPSFSIQRHLIDIPYLGTTADKIYDRIMPNPGGDCKLYSHASPAWIPAANFSVNGRTDGVVCGVGVEDTIPGVEVQAGRLTPNSSDGSGGNSLQFPNPFPFADLDSKAYPCLSYTGHTLCLPPGMYSPQKGMGFEIKEVDTLTIPPGWNMTVVTQDATQYRDPRPPGTEVHSYLTNQSPPAKSSDFYQFGASMDALDTNNGGKAMFNLTAPPNFQGPDPICCLYTETSYLGNAWCKGSGGGPLPDQWKKQSQSVKCFYTGEIYLFIDEYNDGTYQPFTDGIENLEGEAYGNDTYSKNTQAAFIGANTFRLPGS